MSFGAKKSKQLKHREVFYLILIILIIISIALYIGTRTQKGYEKRNEPAYRADSATRSAHHSWLFYRTNISSLWELLIKYARILLATVFKVIDLSINPADLL